MKIKKIGVGSCLGTVGTGLRNNSKNKIFTKINIILIFPLTVSLQKPEKKRNINIKSYMVITPSND